MHGADHAPTPPRYARVAMTARGIALFAAIRRHARAALLGTLLAAFTYFGATTAVVRVYDDHGSLVAPSAFNVLALGINVVLLIALLLSDRSARRRAR